MERFLDYLKNFTLLCAVTVVSAIIVMKAAMYMGGEKAATPDVRGKRVIPALEELDTRGLYLTVTRLEFDDATPKDRIISQDPEPGYFLKKGRSVKVIVSRGSKETLIPDLVGSTELKAEAVLKNDHLKVSRKILVHTEDTPAKVILAQKPEPGTPARLGDALTLLVSAGPFQGNLMAPDFLDMQLAEVMKNIKPMDLKIGRVTYKPHMEKERGVVTGQDPPFGRRVERGSYVTLTVSEGKVDLGETPATFTFFYFTVPDSPGAVKVSVIQDNLDGEKEVYNRVHRPGDTLSLLIEVKGRTAAKVFVNDELVEAKRF